MINKIYKTTPLYSFSVLSILLCMFLTPPLKANWGVLRFIQQQNVPDPNSIEPSVLASEKFPHDSLAVRLSDFFCQYPSFELEKVTDSSALSLSSAPHKNSPFYNRGLRRCPFNLRVMLHNSANLNITDQYYNQIREKARPIYFWSMENWQASLDLNALNELSSKKVKLYWENLAEQFSKVLFHFSEQRDNVNLSEPLIFYFGPNCPETLTECPDIVFSDLASITIVSDVDGTFDWLHPAHRRIYFKMESDHGFKPRVFYEIQVPNQLREVHWDQVHHHLPTLETKEIKDLAFLAEVDLQVGSEGYVYPDYSYLYLPFRHLALENKHYGDQEQLIASIKSVYKRLHCDLPKLQQELGTYIHSGNYPQFSNHIEEFRKSVIEVGLPALFQPQADPQGPFYLKKLELLIGRTVVPLNQPTCDEI